MVTPRIKPATQTATHLVRQTWASRQTFVTVMTTGSVCSVVHRTAHRSQLLLPVMWIEWGKVQVHMTALPSARIEQAPWVAGQIPAMEQAAM